MSLELAIASALHDVAAGAEAIRHASLALTGRPDVGIPARFGYNAVFGPLSRLAIVLGVEVPAPRLACETPRRKPRARRPRAPRALRAKALKVKELAEFVERASPWDPDGYFDTHHTDQQVEAMSCRALLLEVIRRASYDWVLYRTSSKLQNKQLAESAYNWLFVEDERSKAWALRDRNGKGMMSFLNICDTLDLEPSHVRERVKQLTGKDIMGAGRPAERRKVKHSDDAVSSDEHSVFSVDVDTLPTYDPMYSSYE